MRWRERRRIDQGRPGETGESGSDVLAEVRAAAEAHRRVAQDALGQTRPGERQEYLRHTRNSGAQ